MRSVPRAVAYSFIESAPSCANLKPKVVDLRGLSARLSPSFPFTQTLLVRNSAASNVSKRKTVCPHYFVGFRIGKESFCKSAALDPENPRKSLANRLPRHQIPELGSLELFPFSLLRLSYSITEGELAVERASLFVGSRPDSFAPCAVKPRLGLGDRFRFYVGIRGPVAVGFREVRDDHHQMGE